MRLEIDVGATGDGGRRAQVSIAWGGDGAGQETLTTNGSGKARGTLGPFTGDSITVVINDVQGEGWVYRPELNRAKTTLTISAPGDD